MDQLLVHSETEWSQVASKDRRSAGGGYGLVVRDQGPFPRDGLSQNGRFVVFEVGDDGTIGAWQRDSDHWVDLVPWKASAAVRPGNGVNELSVRLSGGVLVFQVNGQPAAQVQSALTDGSVGVFVGGDGNLVALQRFMVQAPRATGAAGEHDKAGAIRLPERGRRQDGPQVGRPDTRCGMFAPGPRLTCGSGSAGAGGPLQASIAWTVVWQNAC